MILNLGHYDLTNGGEVRPHLTKFDSYLMEL